MVSSCPMNYGSLLPPCTLVYLVLKLMLLVSVPLLDFMHFKTWIHLVVYLKTRIHYLIIFVSFIGSNTQYHPTQMLDGTMTHIDMKCFKFKSSF